MTPQGFFTRWFSGAPPRDPAAPRVLAYCASNIGAGPLMRLTRVLSELKRRRPALSILLASDTAHAAYAEQLGFGMLRLPKYEFTGGERFRERPLNLALGNRELARLRAALLLTAGKHFAPDLLLADTNPHGKRDELLPLLRYARRQGIKTALMMRDIPAAENETFKLRGEPAAILRHARFYDHLFVAGDERFFNAAEAYRWPHELRGKSSQSGFIIPDAPPLSRQQAFARWPELDPAQPLAVISCGGGWQPEAVIPPLLDGFESFCASSGSQAQLLITSGHAPQQAMAAWQTRARAMGGVVIERFSPHFGAVLRHADLAVLQAGSTIFEVLETGMPVILLTRPFKTSEQTERAARLSRWPLIRVEPLESLTPPLAAGWLQWGFNSPRQQRATGYRMDGQAAVADSLLSLLPD